MINTESVLLNPEAIKKVEEKYNAKYVLEACLRSRDGNWHNQPAAIFYTDDPHPEGSNYFALYMHHGWEGQPAQLMITNGVSAIQGIFKGARADDGEIIYSRYRHDYRTSRDGSVTVDGGRDYFKAHALPSQVVEFIVVADRLELVENK